MNVISISLENFPSKIEVIIFSIYQSNKVLLFYFSSFLAAQGIWSSWAGIRSQPQLQPKLRLQQHRILNTLCWPWIKPSSQCSQDIDPVVLQQELLFISLFRQGTKSSSQIEIEPWHQSLHSLYACWRCKGLSPHYLKLKKLGRIFEKGDNY